jgi:hypothetical protein
LPGPLAGADRSAPVGVFYAATRPRRAEMPIHLGRNERSRSALAARTIIVPTRMPSAIEGTETSARTKFSEPASAFSSTISVMPAERERG